MYNEYLTIKMYHDYRTNMSDEIFETLINYIINYVIK